jgi:hypothetical protein
MSLALGTAVAMSGAALADSAMKKPEVYKESQAKPHAKPEAGAVKPGAQESRMLHKNTQPANKAGVRDRAVNPDAPMNKKLYEESRTAPTGTEMKDGMK